jgi:ABC-type spermidine/putrescine transport system permease subunit I
MSPVMIILFYLVFRNIDRTLIEASWNCGANKFMTFVRIIFPLTKIVLVNCFIIGLLISFGDILSGTTLGGGAGRSILGRVPLFANFILNEFNSSTNLPRTAALSSILGIIMAMILLLGSKVISRIRDKIE